jgi:hypothetical protein
LISLKEPFFVQTYLKAVKNVERGREREREGERGGERERGSIISF